MNYEFERIKNAVKLNMNKDGMPIFHKLSQDTMSKIFDMNYNLVYSKRLRATQHVFFKMQKTTSRGKLVNRAKTQLSMKELGRCYLCNYPFDNHNYLVSCLIRFHSDMRGKRLHACCHAIARDKINQMNCISDNRFIYISNRLSKGLIPLRGDLRWLRKNPNESKAPKVSRLGRSYSERLLRRVNGLVYFLNQKKMNEQPSR